MDPSVLETVIRKMVRDTSVARVLSVDSQPAVPKGENYLSTITRLKVKVVLGDGRTSYKSLILKDMPPEEAKKQFVTTLGVFRTETSMYTNVLKPMETLMEEFQDTEDILWGRLLHHRPYDSLLFEDLKASGFLLHKRQSCLDLEHGHLVLHSLGRFHGMAKVLEQRGILDGKDYKPYPIVNDKNLINIFLHKGLQTLSAEMQKSWGAKWSEVAKKLQLPLPVLEEKMMSIGGVDESRFNVLNHGDCWSNNMLFRYGWNRRPIALRFLDFQVCHYNSPCWDVTYFMFAAVEPSVRREHYDSLLKTYTDGLLSTLQKFLYPGKHPTHEDLAADMERIAIFRLAVVTIFHAVMTADTTDAIDFEEILTSGGDNGHHAEIYKGERFRQRIGPDLLKLTEQGLI